MVKRVGCLLVALASLSAAWAQGEATPYVSSWAVCGPFANNNNEGFDAVYGPEQDKEFKAGTVYDGLAGKVGWQIVDAADGVLNLLPLFGDSKQNVVAYAYLRVVAPKALVCDVSLGSDDGCKVFCNGELVHANPETRGCVKDQDKAKLTLKEGDNDLLVKVCQGAGEWALALRLTKRDDSLDGVRLTLGKLGGQMSPFVAKYLAIGPFDNENNVGFDAEYGPEKRLDFKRGCDGLGGRVAWQPLAAAADGKVDFKAAFPDRIENAVGYLYVTVEAPREIPCRLLLGSDDGVKVWINGEQVHANNASRPCQPDEDKVDVHLQAGENQVLIKVTQGGGGWEYCMRFAQISESLDGLTFTLPE